MSYLPFSDKTKLKRYSALEIFSLEFSETSRTCKKKALKQVSMILRI